MTKLLSILISLGIFFVSCDQKNSIHTNQKSKKDSVSIYIKKSKTATPEIKEEILKKAIIYNNYDDNDSLRNINLLKVAFASFKLSDSTLFKNSNTEAYNLSLKLNDTLSIADSHWNFGLFYGKKEAFKNAYYHYYQAYKYYELINNNFYSAKMLYNMAFIQSRLRDYTSAESKLFEAISKYKRLNKNTSLYRCHSLLAAIYMNLEDYDNSILYYTKASDYLSKSANNSELQNQMLLNDFAVTYQKMGKYKKSTTYFKKVLILDSLYQKDIEIYATATDNLAYSKLLDGDTTNVKQNMLKALRIRDSLKLYSGIALSKRHLSNYYLAANDTLNAIKFAKASNIIATRIKNNGSRLQSLLLLSEIEKDSAAIHLAKYVALNEKLEKQDRVFKNQFARIRFETDEYIDKAEKLTLQKFILTISIISAIVVFFLIYYLREQRIKTKQLQFESEQQKANEEIYQLMLKQQSTLEEGRLKERYRISEELHDGILGKIFGTRMGLGFMDFKGDSKDTKQYQDYLEDLQKIEEEIRDVSHELRNEILSTNNDYIALIEELVKDKSKLGDFSYTINSEASTFWNDSNDTIKINTYRVTQEVLQNIIKHAKAANVVLEFDYKDDNLILVITDDGVGFKKPLKSKGIGLVNIKSRIESINGQVYFETAPQQSTSIRLEIPYQT